LATAAVSLAPTLNDLPLTGAEVVRQAFRLGVLVDDVSYNLHPRDLADTSPPDTWACVLPDASAEQVQSELDLLHAREVERYRCAAYNQPLANRMDLENADNQQNLHQCHQCNFGDHQWPTGET
jgi:hypothetical protein